MGRLPLDQFTVVAVDGGSTDGSREFLAGIPILDQPIAGRGVAFVWLLKRLIQID